MEWISLISKKHILYEKPVIDELNIALKNGDHKRFLLLLRDIAIDKKIQSIANKTGFAREGIYKMLSINGNPRFSFLLPLIDTLDLSLQIKKKG